MEQSVLKDCILYDSFVLHSSKVKAIAMENRWVAAIGRSWVGGWLEGESVKDVLRGDVTVLQSFPESSAGKESTCNAGDPGWEDPLEEG